MNETDIGGADGSFQPTLWTRVLRAKDVAAPDRREGLDLLIRTYWKPAYFFIRRGGNSVEAAKDLTQSFFATFLEKDFLKSVSPEKGRFRSFLLAALRHFLSNEYDRANAKKRGGNFNFVEAETELASADPTPEEAFRTKWTLEMMGRAMTRLRGESSPEDYSLLAGASPPGLSPTDRKNRLHRIRQRLRELLREIVLPSVDGPGNADTEIRELFSEYLKPPP